MGAFLKALNDGEFPVRWAGDLNYGYGMPLFNFIYHFPYYVSSFFIFLGFGLVWAFKLTLLLSFILSGIFMLLFAKNFFEDDKKAFLATIFYQFYPFRLVELLIRGSFGEVYTYTFLPLVLYGLVKLFKKRNIKNILITSIACGLLILSHNAISLVFYGVIFLFIVFFSKCKKNFFLGLLSLLFGTSLASYYWIPAILEHKYTYGDLFMKEIYKSHFVPFVNFFIPNFFNDPRFQTGGIPVNFGFFQTLGIVFGILFIFRKNKEKRIYIFSLFLICISIFLMRPVSEFLWSNISFLRQFQFPWRLLSVGAIATAFLSMTYLSFSIFKKKVFYLLLVFLVVFSTIYYWKQSLRFYSVKEDYYWNFPLNTTYFGETDVIWSEGPAKSYPKKRVEIISGKGRIINFTRNTKSQKFQTEGENELSIISHTQYFPGWRAYVDGVQVPIQFQDGHWRGQIIFSVPKGRHEIKLSFGESFLRLVADSISLISIILFFILLGISFKNNYEKA